MEQVKLTINGIEYTSIGTYMDNNDGIFHYLPDSEKEIDWINFFELQDSIILLWSLSYLHNEFPDCTAVFGKVIKFIIQADENRLALFLNKYCWRNTLDVMFIDFIFGKYSSYGDIKTFPSIIYNGILISKEEFEFGNHVFIESRRHNEFMGELDILKQLVIKNLKATYL
jgi:hypothetical protein